MKPAVFLAIMVGGLMFFGSQLNGAFGGTNYKKLRALAKARRAKKAKARKRKRG